MNLRLSALLCLGALGCATAPASTASSAENSPVPAPGRPVALPTRLVEDRFRLRPVTPDGQALELSTDTSGGYFLASETVERLKLATETAPGEGQSQMTVALLPDFRPGASIPTAPDWARRIPVVTGGLLKMLRKRGLDADGLLGQAWFSGRVWTFDYPGAALWVRAPGDVPPVEAAHRVALGFRTDAQGQRELNYARLTVKVDGEPVELLLDTGATVALSDAARAALGDGRPAERATSFITRSTFERWRQRHPDWRVLEDADTLEPGSALIEVPALEVAGHTVGPVWFTTRPDTRYHEFFTQLTDKPVEGALGGSALRFFRVTVDYPNAVAVFERPR